MELLLKGGVVYDPANGVRGEVMDVAVRDGKVVEEVGRDAKVLDVRGRLVMPGGVDLHSHIAGSKVDAGRLMRPEDHRRDFEVRRGVLRGGVGYSVPSTFTTGYRYARLGYTTVFEPATPPLKTLHTHDELNDIPMVDKACFPLFGNNWFVMDYVREGRVEELEAYVALLLERLKGYAVKIVDPGCVEAWKWGGELPGLDAEIPRFGITPREVVRALCKAARRLKLPHQIHVHCNKLGIPGNWRETLKTMDCVSDLADGDRPVIHITHAQFNCYGGTDYASIASRAAELAGYVNRHKHVSLDIGQVILNVDTTTMTADGPFEYRLYMLTKGKWVNSDVEVETGAGIVPIEYRRSNYVHAVMWCIGLELALLVKDPWRVFMTTDHPNGGPFTEYPRVVAWLMSRKARERVLMRIPRLARARTNLEGIDREYGWEEIAIVTRAGTARILGLESKGHLGVGADADISVYDIDPRSVDPAERWRDVRKALSRAMYTVKDGRVVVKDGEVVDVVQGRTYWVKPAVPEDLMSRVVSEVREKFRLWYSVEFENYVVPEWLLPRSTPIEARA